MTTSICCNIVSSAEAIVALQQDLNHLHKWQKDWLMYLNPDEYETLRVIKTKKKHPVIYTIHG